MAVAVHLNRRHPVLAEEAADRLRVTLPQLRQQLVEHERLSRDRPCVRTS